jgi:hypothetical protein
MNRAELKKILDDAGVIPQYYSLNGLSGGPYDGRNILENEGTRWRVYFFERGGIDDLQYFNNEDEACRYLLKKLT